MKKARAPTHSEPITGGSNFLISIYHQENHSWQGVIQWLDTGKKVHFRSELELMNLIHGAVQMNQETDEQLRTWEDDHSLKVVK